MKTAFLFIITVILFSTFNVNAALPPTTLGGQDQATAPTTFKFKTPNYSATQVSGIESLIETGNNNILANPSFEHSTYTNGWTTSGTGTFSEETTKEIHGKKSLKVVTSSQTFTLKQNSTLYQTEFADGVQCEASIRVSNTAASVKMCPLKNDVVQSNDCIDIATDGKWNAYTVPFICGGTSNGIQIYSTASTSGTTYIDDAYVGVPKNLSTSSAIGPWVTGTCTSTLTTNATTTCKYRVNGDSMDVQWNTSFSGVNTQGAAEFLLPTGFTVNTSKVNATVQFQQGATRLRDSSPAATYTGPAILENDGTITASIARDTVNSGTTYATIATVDTSANVPITIASGDSIQVTMAGIPVNELNGNVTTYSAPTNANNENVFSAFVSTTGTVTSENIDWINGNCSIVGTSGRSCTLNTGLVTSAMNCTTGDNDEYHSIITASTSSSVTVYTYNTSHAQSLGDFWIQCQKSSTDYQNSRSIVGSFKALDYVYVQANYTGTPATTISSDTPIVFDNENIDNRNAFNTSTGVFTAPEDGIYQISTRVTTQSVANTTSGILECRILTAGGSWYCDRKYGAGVSRIETVQCHAAVYMAKNDTAQVLCTSSVSIAQNATGSRNRLTITKIPGQL